MELASLQELLKKAEKREAATPLDPGAGGGIAGARPDTGAGIFPGASLLPGVKLLPGVGTKRGRVLGWFREGVARGMWMEGEALPGERAVGVRLGVSRVTVRSAMRQLAAAGWLTPGRPGQGWLFTPRGCKAVR